MREILFKGKRADDGGWSEGSLFIANWIDEKGDDEKEYFIQEYPSSYSWGNLKTEAYKVDPSTVGQYTGLTDKNGKKIFEGDILEENRCHFLVVFDQNWAKFKLQHDGHAIQYPEWNRGTRMEIIGNIHDNSELLEGSK